MRTRRDNFGHVKVLLYPCLKYCERVNCSSHVCCLPELLQWFWLRIVIYIGDYGEDCGYGNSRRENHLLHYSDTSAHPCILDYIRSPFFCQTTPIVSPSHSRSLQSHISFFIAFVLFAYNYLTKILFY